MKSKARASEGHSTEGTQGLEGGRVGARGRARRGKREGAQGIEGGHIRARGRARRGKREGTQGLEGGRVGQEGRRLTVKVLALLHQEL